MSKKKKPPSESAEKEQAAGVFAEGLANRGYVALAFDYRRYGESGGEPRSYEDPASKTEDIKSALSFLRARPNVERKQISGVSICASSSYMSHALVGDSAVKAYARGVPLHRCF